MDPELEFSARAVALKCDEKPFPVIGMRPRHTAVQESGLLDPLSPFEQVLLEVGFEPLKDFSRFQMVPHPDWTVRLPLDGTYEIDFKGQTHIVGTRSTPREWCEMVRETGTALLVFQRGEAGQVNGVEVLEALASGNTFAVGAQLTGE
ncbi:hypothetical protein [Streptomyces albidus (ex Kaewkla and Franco 2022)]|uniref:hypothetical protein n=1 Tax=Streptomyces albidus (ex Kaewkla and Franco 2022) TaxID=722709 RepID=UPI0015EE8CF1|nr:hypothetical protein [Streptomyces albidus (ex Kaewkla and Franco 2022)]